MFHSGLKDGRAIQAGSSGQRLPPTLRSGGAARRRSRAGAICQKWRDIGEGFSPVPPLPLTQVVMPPVIESPTKEGAKTTHELRESLEFYLLHDTFVS